MTMKSQTPPQRRAWLAAPAALLVLASATALAEGVDGLAERLASLRSEVEQLSNELSDAQSEQRERTRSLSRQKAELELEKSREELKLKRLRTLVDEKRQEIESQATESKEYSPIFDEKLKAVRAYVEKSLPFRRSERLSSLSKIAEQEEAGLIPPERAISRLWSFMEDELRLTRESGLYMQTITLDGEEHMVDVVRMGMVALYFRTAEDTVGHTVKKGDGWEFVELSDAKQKTRVLELFDQFKKQIRVGYFELPNALSLEQ